MVSTVLKLNAPICIRHKEKKGWLKHPSLGQSDLDHPRMLSLAKGLAASPFTSTSTSPSATITLWRRRPLSISDASVAFVSLTHLAFCFSEYDGPRFRRLCNRPEAQSFLFSRLSIESLSNKKSYRRCIAV